MKKFLIFVLCGTILYVVVSIGLSFLNLSRDWNVIISAVLIGLIQAGGQAHSTSHHKTDYTITVQ